MLRVQIETKWGMLDAREIPYMMSRALNKVANAAQIRQKEHMKRAFKLRREAFVLRGVYISKADRASKTSWRVVIQLAYPDQRHFLDQHEEGGMRTRHGGRRLWQPNQKVFKSRVIGRANPLHPKNLNLKKQGGVLKGDQRTFLVRTGRERLIFQRIGSGGHRGFTQRSMDRISLKNFGVGKAGSLQARKRLGRDQQTRLLYRLVERVKIPAHLAFGKNIERAVRLSWEGAVHEAFIKAMGDAR